MNFNQVETFLVLADCLSVTETAERLNCTQPAVSARIRGLEEMLGVALFDRINKRMHLTASGLVFRDYARKMTGVLQAANEHLRQMGDPLSGTISFGASNFIGIYLIPAFLGDYRKVAPQVEFELDIAPSSQLLNKLEANKLEFLILSDRIALDEARYQFRDICRDTMILVAAPDHPLARRGRCRAADLAGQTFLIKAGPSATRAFVLERIAAQGGKLGREMHISSIEAIKQGVMHGLGVSILSRFTVQRELDLGLLHEVPFAGDFERGIRVVQRRDKLLSPAATRFLDALTDFSGKLV